MKDTTSNKLPTHSIADNEYYTKIAQSLYEWAKTGLPFFWDICEDLKDGSQWICYPPKDGKVIKLLSIHVFNDNLERTVSVDDFTKQYKIIKNTQDKGNADK
jgi:hypothetical protein